MTWHVDKDEIVLNYLSGGNSVLDFGCGDGGYSDDLLSKYNLVDLYDFPYEIDNIDIDNPKIVKYTNWEDVKQNQYDSILSSLVFQHMGPEELHLVLKDMSGMINNELIVKSRQEFNPYICKQMNFQNINVLDYIKEYFDEVKIEYFKKDQIFIGRFKPKA